MDATINIKEELLWLNKSLDAYEKALKIAIKYDNKEKIKEYKKEIDILKKEINILKEKGFA